MGETGDASVMAWRYWSNHVGPRACPIRRPRARAARQARHARQDTGRQSGAIGLRLGRAQGSLLKNRLGDVETDCRDRLHVWLLRIVGALTAPTSMALTCRWPQHQ